MTESELLSLVVEFSIGLGGFSAIAAAFIHQNRSMSAEDIYRVLNMLMMALGPAFIALFTLGILHVSLDIRFANGLLLIYICCALLQAELGKRRLSAKEQKVLIPKLVFVMQTVFVLNGATQLLASAGVLSQGFLVLYAGLVVVLMQAVVQFVRLIVARPATVTDID